MTTAAAHTHLHHAHHARRQERFINDRAFLLEAAKAAGLPADGAAAALSDDPAGPGEALVRQELGKFAGISGVPHFVINGRSDHREARCMHAAARTGCTHMHDLAPRAHHLATVERACTLPSCRRHHLGGAQPPEAFVELFERLLEQQAPAGDGGGV